MSTVSAHLHSLCRGASRRLGGHRGSMCKARVTSFARRRPSPPSRANAIASPTPAASALAGGGQPPPGHDGVPAAHETDGARDGLAGASEPRRVASSSWTEGQAHERSMVFVSHRCRRPPDVVIPGPESKPARTLRPSREQESRRAQTRGPSGLDRQPGAKPPWRSSAFSRIEKNLEERAGFSDNESREPGPGFRRFNG
jgi:hypothetical protein